MEKENQNMIKTGCDRGLCAQAVGRQDRQLNTYDWLADIPGNAESTDLVEVQFKHTRKGYYHNVNHLTLKKGDIVAVEANPGHDIGVVTLIGRLVKMQIKKANLKSADDIKRIYRIARPIDMDKFKEAKAREHETMIQSREIAKSLGLQMKIGDVEYQGDCNKAIFYYIADERVDFRQLIKVLADTFHVRIEMKQIGARQEAGRIGGTGPCGRELCCATWMKNFVSVSTNAARYQDISLNPQKLAGMCAKLKCCLNYEVDDYIEASKNLPSREVVLQTKDGDYYLFKTDILAGIITYSTDKNMAANLEEITAQRAKEIIEMNRNGEKPLSLQEDGKKVEPKKPVDLLSEDINRFDKSKKKKKKGNRDGASQRPQGQDGEDNQMSPSTDDSTTDVQEPNGEDTPRPQGPRGDRSQRPRGDRSQRPRGDRPQGPRGDRPQGPRGDRPQGPRGDRPQGPRGDRPQGPRGDRSQGPRGGNGPRQQGPGRNNQPRQQQPDQQAGPQINQQSSPQPHQQPDQQPSQQQNKEVSQKTDNAE